MLVSAGAFSAPTVAPVSVTLMFSTTFDMLYRVNFLSYNFDLSVGGYRGDGEGDDDSNEEK